MGWVESGIVGQGSATKCDPPECLRAEEKRRSIHSNIRWPRFSLAEVIGWIAAFGIALRFPRLLLPTLAVSLTYLFDRAGFSLLWTLVTVSLIGFVLGTLSVMLALH
jgi:hypothetical protein